MQPYEPPRPQRSSYRTVTASAGGAGIPGMRASYDRPAGSATPIYDSLCAEYRRLFRALPGDRTGEEELRFTGFGPPYGAYAATVGGVGGWQAHIRHPRAAAPAPPAPGHVAPASSSGHAWQAAPQSHHGGYPAALDHAGQADHGYVAPVRSAVDAEAHHDAACHDRVALPAALPVGGTEHHTAGAQELTRGG